MSSSLTSLETQRVNDAIRSNLQGPVPFLTDIIQFLIDSHYTPYRSFLLLRSCGLFLDESPAAAYHTASTLEFLHTAAVLHRNITHTDRTRRELRSLENLWSNEASLLLGDYLLSISFQTLTRLEQLEVLESVSSATKSIARGQILEVAERFPTISAQSCLQVYREKAASLLAAAARCGGIWGGANHSQQKALFHYGEHWGVALVLLEDLRLVQEEERFREKLETRQTLYPLSWWLEQLSLTERKHWQAQICDPNIEISQKIREILLEQAMPATQQVCRQHLQKAKEVIAQDPFLRESSLLEQSLAPIFSPYV